MAKKQTFEDKLKKGGKNLVKIKVVHALDPEKTGNIKFKERMYTVPDGKTPDQFAKELFSK
ncbi:MAG: hypothetical protein CMF87_00195 [Candidatus Marinimicrobia bacterium]|mgnify:FL=1|nr:hypothetical protein [Candidatus Neomarinimicrobiota bacterium]|tara:strand:- start:198 stop:380 length:183 start_codon:yes stop_codon:yes gene_type:complete